MTNRLEAVNTAFALWNHILRTLTVMESRVTKNTMIIWIPILAVLSLGEDISVKGVLGLSWLGLVPWLFNYTE